MDSNDYINKLIKIGEEFDCELLLPPFNNTNNVFYCIDEIRNDVIKFKDFLVSLKKADAIFNSEVIDEKVFIEIEIEIPKEEIEGVQYVV